MSQISHVMLHLIRFYFSEWIMTIRQEKTTIMDFKAFVNTGNPFV